MISVIQNIQQCEYVQIFFIEAYQWNLLILRPIATWLWAGYCSSLKQFQVKIQIFAKDHRLSSFPFYYYLLLSLVNRQWPPIVRHCRTWQKTEAMAFTFSISSAWKKTDTFHIWTHRGRSILADIWGFLSLSHRSVKCDRVAQAGVLFNWVQGT